MIPPTDAPQARIEGELRAPTATAQLIHFHLAQPADDVLRADGAYWFDLCLTPRPRNARVCYPKRWDAHRFQRLGHVFLVPPSEVALMRSDDCVHQASLVLRLLPEPLRAAFGDDLEWTDRRLEASLDIANPNIRSLMLRLAEEIRHPGFASQMLVELVVGQIAIEFWRDSRGVESDAGHGGLAPWRLRLIDERLREPREPPTLSELAVLCKVSLRQLTRGFRASRNRSIGDVIADRRVDHAKRLLGQGQRVKAVAYTLGFSSPSAFCFAFRRATGTTPREFTRRVLQ